MGAKKFWTVVFFPLVLTSLVWSQSLTEIAKKERERREVLKEKKSLAVTNADLAKVKLKPAVAAGAEAEDKAAEVKTEAAGQESESLAEETPEDTPAEARKRFEQQRVELETAWTKAKENVEVLSQKMKALVQQFYSFNSMMSKDQIQRTMAETFQSLQDAQANEAEAKAAVDDLVAAGPKLRSSAAEIR
jgi:hypothetical protein